MKQDNFYLENSEHEEISIIEIVFHYLHYWKFFLLSIIICLGLTYTYLLYTTPEYKITSRVVISDEKKGQTPLDMTAFSDLGIISPKNNLDNEVELLRSQTLMKGVVDSLRINISYMKKKAIKKVDIYKKTPIYVSVQNIMATGSFIVSKTGENTVSIRSDKENFNQEVEINQNLNSPWGILRFSINPFGTESYPVEIEINDSSDPKILPNVQINAVSKTSSVVELSLITPTPQKGQDVINTLVAHYNRNAIDDKNYVANNSIAFIDERLLDVRGDLQSAESNVENYQKTQGITDLHAQGQLLLSSSSEYNKKVVDTDMQLNLLLHIKNYIMNPVNKENTVPSNVGLTDPTVISLINRYNEEVLAQKKATVGLTKNHPIFIDFENQIALMREDLLKGIDISEASMKSTIRELRHQENMSIGKARNLSTLERGARDLYRQQSLKEFLFNYLAQKKEEIGLSLVTATPNAKVVDAASFDPIPVKPKKMIILLAAFMLAIVIPTVIIYILDLLDNKVHTKEDVIKIVKAPFLGIIPVVKNTEVFPVLKLRSAIAERFRAIISNLEFIVGKEGKRKVIAITSTTSDEGKSFFARNLAMSLATMGKKTLLIDLDLRKSEFGKLFELKTPKGIALFLSDPRVRMSEIVDTTHAFHQNLDIISVHAFPPNPAELLASDRLDQLFQIIGREYEYVIVDTAPVGLVADIYSINPFSTAVIYMVRSDYTLNHSLAEIQELYKEKKFHNLCVALNAVSEDNIYGFYGKYGKYGKYQNKYYMDEK
jgi:capsular exopolysaccharide synthesis family protein